MGNAAKSSTLVLQYNKIAMLQCHNATMLQYCNSAILWSWRIILALDSNH